MEAAAEFDNRPGPVRDLIAETMGMWMDLLVEQAGRALERGELAPGTDPAQLAWELHAFGLALNWDRQLNGAREARASVRRPRYAGAWRRRRRPRAAAGWRGPSPPRTAKKSASMTSFSRARANASISADRRSSSSLRAYRRAPRRGRAAPARSGRPRRWSR